MQCRTPEWLGKYEDIGFDDGWSSTLTKNYPNSLLDNLPRTVSPERFAVVNPLCIENHSEISELIDVPQRHTLPEVLRFVLDMLNVFGRNLPSEDAKISAIYRRMDEDSRFYTEYPFADFYVFCRRLQYVDLTKMYQYSIVDRMTDELSFNGGVGTTHQIEYEDCNLTVIVQKRVGNGTILSDPMVEAEIVESDCYMFEVGEILRLSPLDFD